MPLTRWLGWQGAASAVLGFAVAAGLWLWLAAAIEAEAAKVQFLKYEVAKLDREIAEVSSLKDDIARLLARKQVAEALQQDRLGSVQLLEQLARQRPAGVQFTAVREEQGRVFMTGLAASEGAIAALLANLGRSPVFERAELVEVGAGRFGVRTALKGGRLTAARPAAARIPSDVHPGDPK